MKAECAMSTQFSERLVAHVDINSYFATLLQQENPQLRGRPVGVIKDVGRSCLIAVSKEAKQRGIQTGASLADVQQLVPDLVLVPAQFDFTLAATKRLQTLFHDLVPSVEIYSLDEAFLDLTGCRRLFASPEHFGQLVQKRIQADLGEWVTCNVGIAPNRFLAKMASETGAKGSITLVNEENLNQHLCQTAFRDVCGVGWRLEQKLAAIGVQSLYQLNLVDDITLERQVGPYWREQLRRMAEGQEPDLLQRLAQPLPHMKSVGRSITGFHLFHDELAVKRILHNLVLETTHKARQMHLKGRYVSVALWGQAGQHHFWHAHHTLPYFLNQGKQMWEVVHDLLMGWQERWPVIKFAVRLSMLLPDNQTPNLLWPSVWRRQEVEEAVDQIAQKYGLFTIRPATLLRGKDIIRPEVTGFLGDKHYQLGDEGSPS